jgi:hypothetical protein
VKREIGAKSSLAGLNSDAAPATVSELKVCHCSHCSSEREGGAPGHKTPREPGDRPEVFVLFGVLRRATPDKQAQLTLLSASPSLTVFLYGCVRIIEERSKECRNLEKQ